MIEPMSEGSPETGPVVDDFDLAWLGSVCRLAFWSGVSAAVLEAAT